MQNSIYNLVGQISISLLLTFYPYWFYTSQRSIFGSYLHTTSSTHLFSKSTGISVDLAHGPRQRSAGGDSLFPLNCFDLLGVPCPVRDGVVFLRTPVPFRIPPAGPRPNCCLLGAAACARAHIMRFCFYIGKNNFENCEEVLSWQVFLSQKYDFRFFLCTQGLLS